MASSSGDPSGAQPRPRARRLLPAVAATLATAALLALAVAGWIHRQDQQVIARHAPAAAEAAAAAASSTANAAATAAAVDHLMDTEACNEPPLETRREIRRTATVIHVVDNGDWGTGRQEIKVYRHRYLDYYVEYTTGFFPAQRQLCKVD